MKTIEDAFRCMTRGKYLEAESIYRQITKGAVDNAVAYFELSWIFLLQHKYEEAEKALRKVLQISPDNTMAYYDLARVCLLQRDYHKAEKTLLQAVKHFPNNNIIRYQLGRILRLLGKTDKANVIFDELKVKMPYLCVEEEEQFFDSLIQLEPVSDLPLDDMTLADNNIDMTLADPHADDITPAPLVDESEADMTLADPLSAINTTISDSVNLASISLATENTGRRSKGTAAYKAATKIPVHQEKNLKSMLFDDILAKEKLLGRGGMGEVYLVNHLEWDKKLAVKRCLQVEDAAVIESFRQECLAWLSLEKHPNVVSAVHFTTWEEIPSLLMEYIDGITLKVFIKNMRIASMIERILAKLGTRPPLSKAMSILTFFGNSEERKEIALAWMTIIKEHTQLSLEEVRNIFKEARAFHDNEIESLQDQWFQLQGIQNNKSPELSLLIDYVIQICWGMAHAHRHGMLHRDLKPANVLLEQESQTLKVTDFGLAVMNEKTRHKVDIAGDTSSTAIVGTPRYMAPEQWDHQSTEKSDIYAFGIILYEIMSYGHSPFSSHVEDGETPFWWANIPQQNEFYYWSVRHSSEKPIPPRHFHENISSSLENLILQCLEKRPEQRPASFIQIASRLMDIYRETTGENYPKEQRIATDLMAMELNNRALSLLEMNFTEKGNKLLKKALQIAPNLVEAQINHALYELALQKISLAGFTNKILNCFGADDKDITNLEILAGVYFRYGCFWSVIEQKFFEMGKKFAKDYKFKRMKGKWHYILGEYGQSFRIFYELCMLENSRLEDWYHMLGTLYHKKQYDTMWQKMEQAPPHFKFHPSFQIIKKLASREDIEQKGNWYEIASLENPQYKLPISFLVNDPEQNFVLIFRSNDCENICEYYAAPNWQAKTIIIPIGNILSKDQVCILPNRTLAALSIDGFIQIHNIETGITREWTVPALPASGYQCHDGFLHRKKGFLIATFLYYPEMEEMGNIYSQILVFEEVSGKLLGNTRVDSEISCVTLQKDGAMCWFSDSTELYTWDLRQQPQKQCYGYQKETENSYENRQIIFNRAVSDHKLLLLLQEEKREKEEQVSLHIYLWDMAGQDHKQRIEEDFVAIDIAISFDGEKLYLLGETIKGQQVFLIWKLTSWQEISRHKLFEHYRSFQITYDQAFILLYREDQSLLDVGFEEDSQQENVLCRVNSWEVDKRFQLKAEMTHLASSRYLFIGCDNGKTYVWKKVQQEPFPLLHKLSFMYVKPTSTVQDIGLQERIKNLLQESERALREKDLQTAIDYIRGIQNFKGYDWRLVMDRIYKMASDLNWQKIGLRESLKMRKLSWKQNDFIVSPKGDYLAAPFFARDAIPHVYDTSLLQEESLQYIVGKIAQTNGYWFTCQEGRYIIRSTRDKLFLYDLQKQKSLEPINCQASYQEALADKEGHFMVLKENGFNKLTLLDLQTFALHREISHSKYHTLRDACIIVTGAAKILLATEAEGGFHWEMIMCEDGKWNTKLFETPFTEDLIGQGYTDEDTGKQCMIANRSYIIFKGTNFDLMRDIHFNHIQVFELKHGIHFSLIGKEFSEKWLKAVSIATSTDGYYTFLSLGQGQISCWKTSGHIANWREIMVLHEHNHPITALTVTMDGKFLISGDRSGYIKIIRIGSGQNAKEDWEIMDELKADNAIEQLYITDEGRRLFALQSNAIHVWEIDWVWEIERYVE